MKQYQTHAGSSSLYNATRTVQHACSQMDGLRTGRSALPLPRLLDDDPNPGSHADIT